MAENSLIGKSSHRQQKTTVVPLIPVKDTETKEL